MGLAACPRASFAWVEEGRAWKALLRTCSAPVPGTVWVGCRHRHRIGHVAIGHVAIGPVVIGPIGIGLNPY